MMMKRTPRTSPSSPGCATGHGCVLLSALFLLLAGCDDSFRPETLVEDFRVLSLTLEPPELRPGQAAQAKMLVVDPSRPGKRNTVVWLACDPDPFNLGRSACTSTQDVFDTSILDGPEDQAPQLPPPGMRVIGYNELGAYQAPSDVFSVLPQGDVRRQQGTVANILALAVADEVSITASPAEFDALYLRIRRKEVRSVAVVSRVRVTQGDGPLNQNPVLAELSVDGEPLPQGAKLRVLPKAKPKLSLSVPEASFETYSQLTPEGQPQAHTEKLVASWYSTFGRFSAPRQTLEESEPPVFLSPPGPEESLPQKPQGSLWVVVRDTRGGQAFKEVGLYLCDPSAPAPALATVVSTVDAATGTRVLSFTGTALEQVLDVSVGQTVLQELSYSPGRGVLEGLVPALPPGAYPLTLRAKNCQDVETGQAYTAP